MTYQMDSTHRAQPSPPLHSSSAATSNYWAPTVSSSDPYFTSPNGFSSWNYASQSMQPKAPMDPSTMHSEDWHGSHMHSNPGNISRHVPRRLSNIGEPTPNEHSRFGPPPYTLPALTPDISNSPRFQTRATYPSSYSTPSTASLPGPMPTHYPVRQYSVSSYETSPHGSYSSLHHSSDGGDSPRSLSPPDHRRDSVGGSNSQDDEESIRRPHVASSAIRDASHARRSRDARFFCEVLGCGSNFTTKSNLQGHMRSHANERPYACQAGCGKAFTRQSDRHRHEGKVHPEMSFPRSGRRRRASSLLEHNKRFRPSLSGSLPAPSLSADILSEARYSFSEMPGDWFPGMAHVS